MGGFATAVDAPPVGLRFDQSLRSIETGPKRSYVAIPGPPVPGVVHGHPESPLRSYLLDTPKPGA